VPNSIVPLPENNLLLRLHKWAWRQDENFLTEAFAHLLQHLLIDEPEAAVRILQSITNGFLALCPGEARSVEVRTQVFTVEGTPDLQLRTSKQIALLEVKSEADAHPEQLKRYRKLLRDSGLPSALVLLTRYPVTLGEQDERPDAIIRWYQVAEWLELERNRYAFKPVSEHLVSQFLDFLSGRNMTMGQVTWELSGGVRALRALNDVLYEVANACGLQAQPWGDRSSLGIFLDKRNYWIGIQYDQPESLSFQTWNREVDKDAAERLGINGLYEWADKGRYGWHRPLDLESEDVHFFARSNTSQRQVLEQFLRECLDTVKRIEIRSAEPPADATTEPDSSGTEPPGPPRRQ
jgi:hypothetical protein